MLRRVARGKGEDFERQNREDARHGVENQATQKGQSQGEQKGHVCGSRRLKWGAGCHIRRRSGRDRTAADIDLQILCLGRVAEAGVGAALI